MHNSSHTPPCAHTHTHSRSQILMKLPAVNSIGWNIIKHAGYSMFLICILRYRGDLVQFNPGVECARMNRITPTALYRTLSPPDQCMH